MAFEFHSPRRVGPGIAIDRDPVQPRIAPRGIRSHRCFQLPKDALHVGRDDAPHTTLEFVPGGGHYLVDENPAEVARRIGDFLRL